MKFTRTFFLFLLFLSPLPKDKAESASGQETRPPDLEESIRSHILKGETLHAIEILNQYLSTTRVYEKRAISQFTISQISRYGIKEDAARYPFFTPSDAGYIKESLFYSRLARRITAGINNDKAKILALLDWTSSHIQSTGRSAADKAATPAVKENDIDFPAFPWQIMERGYGLCSRQCWVLATLARSLGYKAGVMYLRGEEDLISHHTLTWVILPAQLHTGPVPGPREDSLYLFDPYTGVPILWPDGSPSATGPAAHNLASYLNCLERPEIIDNFRILPARPHTGPVPGPGGQGHWMKSADLKNAIIWIVASPRSLLPKMALLQEILNEAPEAPLVWTDLEAEVQKVYQALAPHSPLQSVSLPLRFHGWAFVVDLWFFPFGLEASSTRVSFQEKRKEAHKFLALYAGARRQHLLGEYEKAKEEYSLVQNRSHEPAVKEDVEFFLALLFLDMGKAPEAAEKFQKYLKDYPEGFWRPLTMLNLGKAFEKMGEYEKAARAYEKVPPPMALGAGLRAKRLLTVLPHIVGRIRK